MTTEFQETAMAKTNVAIIVGVSDYDTGDNLPACKNDAALMRRIIEGTGKFAPDNTLYIDTGTNSGRVKGDLAKFVERMRTYEVGELFFYYTGHGLFDGKHFYYIFSDYISSRLMQTTLTNAELDDMFRSLKPELAVKTIDACHSAQQYVKSPEEMEKALKATGTSYNNCYFMFSSEQQQSSWQDSNTSYFTLEFAKAIQTHSSPSIRYKDIIDYISDRFTGNARQRPVFVTQGSFTDEFCAVDNKLRQAITALLPVGTTPTTSSTTTTTTTTLAPTLKRPLSDLLKERVHKEANQYCTEDEAKNAFDAMKTVVQTYSIAEPASGLYKLRPTFMVDKYEVPDKKPIGEWLKNKPGDYFAIVEYIPESYEDEELYYPRSRSVLDFAMLPEKRIVTKHRDVVNGFESTAKLLYKAIHLVVEPALENLPWWHWYCALIVSKKEIRCFTALLRLKEVNWKERKEAGKVEWRTTAFPMKQEDEVKSGMARLLDQLSESISKYLLERFELTEEGNEQKDKPK